MARLVVVMTRPFPSTGRIRHGGLPGYTEDPVRRADRPRPSGLTVLLRQGCPVPFRTGDPRRGAGAVNRGAERDRRGAGHGSPSLDEAGGLARTTPVCAPSVVEPRPGEGARPLGPPRCRHLGSPLSPGRLPSTTLGADVTRVRGNDVAAGPPGSARACSVLRRLWSLAAH
jgi:hypothetical protein